MTNKPKISQVCCWSFDFDNLLGTVFYWDVNLQPSVIQNFCLLRMWEFLLNMKDLNLQNGCFKGWCENLCLSDLIKNDIKQWYLQRFNFQLFLDMAYFVENYLL